MAKIRTGVSAAKPKQGWKDLDSYTIRGTNKVVRVEDCVLMRPSDTGKTLYVSRIEKIESDSRNNVKVQAWWYYRPEESLEGTASVRCHTTLMILWWNVRAARGDMTLYSSF